MIEVRRCELAAAVSDAIVRPVRADGEAITAAGRRLELAAGFPLSDHLHDQGELPVGGAIVTRAGDALGATYLVHVVLQSAEEAVSAAGVQRAVLNALRRARDLDMESVAFSPVSGGAGNLDAEEAAFILVGLLADHLLDGVAPTRFEILVETDYEKELFDRQVAALKRATVRRASKREPTSP